MLRIVQSIVCVLVGSCLSFSQGALEITLTDNQGIPLGFQEVYIENPIINLSKVATTNQLGMARLDGLPTNGLYSIRIDESAFAYGQELTNIQLISNKVTSINLSVQPKSLALTEATITAADYQPINTLNAEVASELTAKELQAIPIEGRDITRALFRLPNITQATGFYPEAPNVAINGANSLYTNYQIDGLDNNENFLGGQRFAMPLGFTQNITALTNNFSAEHGLTSNGIINITTKSGSNEVQGEAFYVVRPGPALDAASPFAQRDLSGNQVRDGFQRHQVGCGIGGPLARNKTFYFINVEHTTDLKDNLINVPQLNLNQTIRGTNTFTYMSAKLDHFWSDQWQSSLRVNKGLVAIERQGGGLEGGVTFPSAGNSQDRNSLNIALKNAYQGKGYTYEVNFQHGQFDWNYAMPNQPNSPNVTVLDPRGLTLAVVGHPGFIFDERERSQTLQQKLTIYKNKHVIKTGFEWRRSAFTLFGGGNPNGSYTVQLNQNELEALQQSNVGLNLSAGDIPATAQVLNYNIELRPNAFGHTQQIVSAYIEDQWSLDQKWNMNLGLRYDYDNLSRGGGNSGDYNNLAPRISLNYKASEQLSLRTGYGMYYDKILYAVYSDAIQFNSNNTDYLAQINALSELGILPKNTDPSAVTNEGNLVASADGVPYLQGPQAAALQEQRASVFSNERRILNPNGYQNPYSHQWMVGMQYQMDDQTQIYVDLMHNRSHNLFRLRNLNAPAAYPIDPDNVVVRTPEEADATRPIPVFSDNQGSYSIINNDTLRGIARNIVMTESAGRSNYYALNATLQKDKGSGHVSYRLMYTLSLLENNTEDINFRAMDGNDFDAEWGPSINDRTHLINGLVTYHLSDYWNISLTGLLQSGQPINRIPDAGIFGTTDLNGDGRSFGDAYVGNSDRHPGEDRNSDRLPWSNTFDLSSNFIIKLGKGHIEFGAQIFNLFNATNLSGYSNNATQSNQIQVGSAASGLLVRRNAAPPRQFQFSTRYIF